MTTPVIESVPDLERIANEFEREWQNTGTAELPAFLPSRNHSHFERISCELVCIDMEMRWLRGTQKILNDYLGEFPHIFMNPDVVQELAYEDYRQHIQAGKPIQSHYYRDRFGIDVSHWPPLPDTKICPPEERTQVLCPEPIVDGLSRTSEARAAIVGALRRSSPQDADRLDEAFAEMPKKGDRVLS
jgi:hypothetical protein